jgi:selenocysteine-specific elongation factor
MYVIGTAGHVDHGKSSLIQALTGINPDRLREEQERGLTIELGFAWLTLPSGREVSIVDVPGHVRFVRHMLAGIGAVDLALVVIAADEGVMPQTQEHLEILDLLEVRHAVVALSKMDMVEGDWADLVEEEVRELIAETSIGGAPIVRVSSVTGEGLEELKATLDAALDAVEEPSDIGRPRLGIDRVFTMSGFGTVVTGTLLGGVLRLGDTLEVAPDGPTARVRGLQTHGQAEEEAQPGTRVAVNLSGVGTSELSRGQVLAPPGRMSRVTAFDVRLRVLSHRALAHNLRVHVHTGAAEVQGRVRVLDGDEIGLGESGWAQVVLREPLALVAGDLVVLRVSDETMAGGRVVAVNPERHRRRDGATIERLEAMSAGTPESAVLAALERLEPVGREPLLAAVEQDSDVFDEALAALVDEGAVRELASDGGALYLMAAGLERLRGEAERALAGYHAEFPLRWTMPREELRSRLGLGQREFAAVLGALGAPRVPGVQAPGIVGSGDGVSEEGWTPEPSAAESAAIAEVERVLAEGGLQAPRIDADAEVVAYLSAAGRVVDCGNGVVVSAPAFAEAERRVRALLAGAAEMTLGEARDALETNRRVAQGVLEELDRRGVTRRQGDARVLAG